MIHNAHHKLRHEYQQLKIYNSIYKMLHFTLKCHFIRMGLAFFRQDLLNTCFSCGTSNKYLGSEKRKVTQKFCYYFCILPFHFNALRLNHSLMSISVYREAKIIILSYMKTLSYHSLHCIGTHNFQCNLTTVRFSLLVNGLVILA